MLARIGLAALAIGGGAAAQAEPGTPATMRRFAYVTTAPATGAQTLHLAELTTGARGVLGARTVMKLGGVPGDQGANGQVPETYYALSASRGNRRIASVAVQLGLDFVDVNITVYDLGTGTAFPTFNEHRFSSTSKANCKSKKFDAFVASEVANGVPPAIIAGYDFGVQTEGAQDFQPVVSWDNDGGLRVRFTFEVLAKIGPGSSFSLGSETFDYEVALGDGLPHALSCNAGKLVLGRPPKMRLGLRPAGSAYPGRITYDGVDLRFGSGKQLPPSLPRTPFLLSYVKAERVGGYPQ